MADGPDKIRRMAAWLDREGVVRDAPMPEQRGIPGMVVTAADEIERLRAVVEAVRDMRGAAVAGGFLTAYDLWWEAVLDALLKYEAKTMAGHQGHCAKGAT